MSKCTQDSQKVCTKLLSLPDNAQKKTKKKQFLVPQLKYKFAPVIVKMDPPKLVLPGTNFTTNKDPRNLFYCKIWTPSEKFGPPPTDERT